MALYVVTSLLSLSLFSNTSGAGIQPLGPTIPGNRSTAILVIVSSLSLTSDKPTTPTSVPITPAVFSSHGAPFSLAATAPPPYIVGMTIEDISLVACTIGSLAVVCSSHQSSSFAPPGTCPMTSIPKLATPIKAWFKDVLGFNQFA